MKRVLITGGAGFIGSHLCDFFLAKGFEVVCMDNLITGKKENIKHIKKNFTFIEHDVTKYIDIKGDLDYVLHFASPASPIDYQKFPIQTMKVGSLGTHNVLGVAKAKNAVFLQASTSEVYGDPQENPQKEDYWGHVNPIGPRSVYDESKRFAEAITMAYHNYHKMDTKIARIFNTYGPRMRMNDGRVVPTFINQAIRNQPITIFGDGKQTRSFCYVSDLIDGIYKLLMSNINTPVNLGNPHEMSMLEYAQNIVEITNSKSKTVFKPLPKDDPKQRCPDISKAKKLLNWEPKVSFEEGMKKTIEWFRNK